MLLKWALYGFHYGNLWRLCIGIFTFLFSEHLRSSAYTYNMLSWGKRKKTFCFWTDNAQNPPSLFQAIVSGHKHAEHVIVSTSIYLQRYCQRKGRMQGLQLPRVCVQAQIRQGKCKFFGDPTKGFFFLYHCYNKEKCSADLVDSLWELSFKFRQ